MSTDSMGTESDRFARMMLIRSVFFASIFAACFFLFYDQLLGPKTVYDNFDLIVHVHQSKMFTFKNFFGLSHPGFPMLLSGLSTLLRVSHESVAVYLLSASVVLIAYVINRILACELGRYSEDGRITEPDSGETSKKWNLFTSRAAAADVRAASSGNDGFFLFVTLMLVLVTAIYMPFFNINLYLGQSSPNAWHNPTILLSKPFAFMTFYLFPLLLCGKEMTIKKCIFISLLFVWCTVIKPSFALAFLPACGLYVLLRHLKSRQAYVKALIVVAPVVLLMVVQYFNTFGTGSESGIEIAFLKAVSMYTPNYFVSLLLVSAFPLCILLFRSEQCFSDHHLLLSWLMFFVAFFQGAFFIETGPRMEDGNFGWAFQLALHLVFICGMIELIRWLRQADYTNNWVRIKLSVTTTVFSLHFVSGVYYFGKYLAGGGFY